MNIGTVGETNNEHWDCWGDIEHWDCWGDNNEHWDCWGDK